MHHVDGTVGDPLTDSVSHKCLFRYRSHGNEQWQFNEKGLMERRDASINDTKIEASERRYTRNAKTGLVEYPHGHP